MKISAFEIPDSRDTSSRSAPGRPRLSRPSLAFSAATQAHQLADRRLTRRGCALCTDYQNAVQDLRCCCLPCRRGCVPGWLARVARERAQGVDGDGRGRRRVAGRARQGTGARTLFSRGARAQPCAEALPAASCQLSERRRRCCEQLGRREGHTLDCAHVRLTIAARSCWVCVPGGR